MGAKKERLSKERQKPFTLGQRGKVVKNCKMEQIIRFCELFTRITSKSLMSLFFTDRWEQVAHVTLLLRATRVICSQTLILTSKRAICSWSLFCKERQERIAHCCSLIWAMLSKRANSQPWHSPFRVKLSKHEIFWILNFYESGVQISQILEKNRVNILIQLSMK